MLVLLLIIILISIAFVFNHYYLKQLNENYQNTALWLAIAISKKEIDKSVENELDNDLFVKQVYKMLIDGKPKFFSQLSISIEIIFYSILVLSIFSIVVLGGIGHSLFLPIVLTGGIAWTTAYCVDKVFPKNKILSKPLIYFLNYFKRKNDLDISKQSINDINSIYSRCGRVISLKMPEIINLYKHTKIKPPSSFQIKYARNGDIRYLIDEDEKERFNFLS